MRGIYDTTKPSAAFGGTFSISWVRLLCVITILDLKPRNSLPPQLPLEEAVPRPPKPVSALTEAASSGRIHLLEPGRVLLSTCLHGRDAYNFLTFRYSDAAISLSSRDQLGNGDHNSGLSAKGPQAGGSMRKVLNLVLE